MTEERPPYLDPQSLVDLLRGLSRHEHGDFTIGDDAADEIERLRGQERLLTIEIERLRSKLETISELLVDIRFHAVTAAQLAAVKQIREE